MVPARGGPPPSDPDPGPALACCHGHECGTSRQPCPQAVDKACALRTYWRCSPRAAGSPVLVIRCLTNIRNTKGPLRADLWSQRASVKPVPAGLSPDGRVSEVSEVSEWCWGGGGRTHVSEVRARRSAVDLRPRPGVTLSARSPCRQPVGVYRVDSYGDVIPD